jgi:hypothetical protein
MGEGGGRGRRRGKPVVEVIVVVGLELAGGEVIRTRSSRNYCRRVVVGRGSVGGLSSVLVKRDS